jgi:hypothetical protein
MHHQALTVRNLGIINPNLCHNRCELVFNQEQFAPTLTYHHEIDLNRDNYNKLMTISIK